MRYPALITTAVGFLALVACGPPSASSLTISDASPEACVASVSAIARALPSEQAGAFLDTVARAGSGVSAADLSAPTGVTGDNARRLLPACRRFAGMTGEDVVEEEG